MRKNNTTTPASLIKLAPEVEAHRKDYQALAESFIQMGRLEYARSPELLDVRPPDVMSDEPEPHIMLNAINAHLRALFDLVLDTYTDEFWRTLYVELRLFYDQQAFEMKRGPFDHPGKRKGGAR